MPPLNIIDSGEYIKNILKKIRQQKTIEEMFELWINEIGEYKFDDKTPHSLSRVFLKKNGYELYLRFSERQINSELRRCFDIAQVAVPPKFQNRGWFKNFILLASKTEGIDGIYVESVSSKILRAALPKWNFILVDKANNYFLEINQISKT